MSTSAKLTAALLAVLLLIGSHWYAYQAGNRNGTNAALVKSQGDELGRRNSVIEHLQILNQQYQAQAERLAADAQKAIIDHEKELQAVRAASRSAADQRVPIDADLFCRANASATESAATGSHEQADPGAAFLPEPFARDLRQLAADADEVTADLRYLVRRAEEAGCFR